MHALLLRESGKTNGGEVDVHAITDRSTAAASGIPDAEALIALSDAMVGEDEAALSAARERVLVEMGAEPLVDAVAVASHFERMVRIADGTGIPLDPPVAILTADLRQELGVDSFTAAASTPRSGPFMRLLRPVLVPVMERTMRLLIRRKIL